MWSALLLNRRLEPESCLEDWAAAVPAETLAQAPRGGSRVWTTVGAEKRSGGRAGEGSERL